MKKYFFLLLSVLVFSTGIYAQDGKNLLKKASKSISKYDSDPAQNAAKLQEAIDFINQALQDDEISATAKAWNVKGHIFNSYADNQIKANILDPNAKLTEPRAAIIAFEAYAKALSIAEKKGDKKDALNGLLANEGHLSNTGIAMYSTSEYAQAYENFNDALIASKLLRENEKTSRMDDPEIYRDQVFFTAVSGYYGGKVQEVIPHLEEMDANGTDQPFVYEALFSAHSETDSEKAISYLEKGRATFPDDTGLLFAEINHYLKIGELDALIDKLKLALEKEPDNVSIYTTLGNVYDNLHQSAKKDGDTAKSSEYFDLSKDYYQQAIDRKPDNFDANYSLGALYYNKAADMTTDLNTFANDFSKEGTKKYNEMKAVMDGLFAKALPFFEKAEAGNANDLNTLIALKEIYARTNKFDKSNEYKARIDAIQANKE